MADLVATGIEAGRRGTQGDPRRSPRSGPRPDRRQQVLDAAIALFSDRPFDDITIADVAEEAGVARGLPSYYFGDKRGLYLEAFRHVAGRINSVELRTGDDAPADERLRRLVRHQFDVLARNRQAFVNLMASGLLASPAIHAVLEETWDEVVATVCDILAAPTLPPPAIRTVLRCWVGMLPELAFDWLQHEDLPEELVVQLAVDTLLAGLQSVAAYEPMTGIILQRLAAVTVPAGDGGQP
jgi:AcrR family transcriptional regulator